MLTQLFLALCSAIRWLRFPGAANYASVEQAEQPVPTTQPAQPVTVSPRPCPSCGWGVPTYAVFCEMCGALLGEAKQNTDPIAQQPAYQPGERLRQYQREFKPDFLAGDATTMHRSVHHREH